MGDRGARGGVGDRQARRPRGRGRAAPGLDARLARPRRPRGRRLRGPRVDGRARCGPRPASRSRCARRSPPGQPQMSWRDGYRVIRKAGRYMVFPRAAFSEMMGWHGGRDGLVEIWNGMPFFSPLWARTPAHHVAAPRARRDVGHDAAAAARAASAARSSRASRRRSTGARRSSRCRTRRSRSWSTTSASSRPPGARRAAGHRPALLARRREVADAARRRGRPARAGEALRAARSTRWSRCKPRAPGPRGGDRGRGLPPRPARDARSTRPAPSAGSTSPATSTDDELVDLYRRAWLLASASAREGWGMTLTEAAACGTPGGGHPHRRAHSTRSPRARPGCSPTGRDELARRARPGALATPTSGTGSPPARSTHAAQLHLGGDRPRDARGARGRGDAPAPPPVTAAARASRAAA